MTLIANWQALASEARPMITVYSRCRNTSLSIYIYFDVSLRIVQGLLHIAQAFCTAHRALPATVEPWSLQNLEYPQHALKLLLGLAVAIAFPFRSQLLSESSILLTSLLPRGWDPPAKIRWRNCTSWTQLSTKSCFTCDSILPQCGRMTAQM